MMRRKGRSRGRAGRVLLSAVLLLSQLMAFAAVPAAACDRALNAEVLAHLGGQVNKVAVSGSYAFAAATGGLVVFDVSDPAAPVVVAELPTRGAARDIAVSGTFAYVVGDWGEMQIVDVTDPTAPVARGAIGWGDVMRGVAVSGNRAYVLSDYHGLKMVNVADKDEPYLVDYVAPPSGSQYFDIAISGTKAFVTFGVDPGDVRKIRMFDITNINDAPVKVGNDFSVTGTNVSVTGIAASGNLVYAAEWSRGLEIVDFTTPSAPVRRGMFATGAGGVDVALSGTTAYVAAAEYGLHLVNVADPANPTGLNTMSGEYWSVTVAGGRGYLTGGPALYVAFIDPVNPYVLGSAELEPADARDVALADDGFLYVAAGDQGLLKVDFDPAGGAEIVGRAAATDASKLVVSGAYAFVADGLDLKTYSLAGPAPVLVGTKAGVGDIEGMFVDGPRLYLALGDDGLKVFTLLDPAAPALAGTYDTAESPIHAVAADGERLFVGIDGGNVVSLNAANPASMSEITRMGTYGDVVSLSLDGDILYAGTTEKIYRIAAGEPDDLYQIGRYKYFGFATTSLIGRGGYAYAGTENGFYLVDFSDVAAEPYDAMHFGADSLMIGGLAMDADGIYLAARDGGFFALSVPVLRTSGSSRYDTAVELSAANWPSATSVVLATGANFADAACAAPLAHALGGPLLLVPPAGITQGVLDEIARLGATRAVIIGSDRAVPATVEAALAGVGVTDVDRLAGWNRYDTARMVAHEFKVAKGSNPATAFMATGDNFPDALSVSGIAAALDCPVLLTKASYVPTPTLAAIEDLGNPAIIAVGSEKVISKPVYDQLGCEGRLFGATRYETAKEVADYGLANGFTPEEIIVTSGLNFPDALVSGVVSAKHTSPILLTSTGLPSATGQFIDEHQDEIRRITVVGSARAVSQDVEDQIVDALVW